MRFDLNYSNINSVNIHSNVISYFARTIKYIHCLCPCITIRMITIFKRVQHLNNYYINQITLLRFSVEIHLTFSIKRPFILQLKYLSCFANRRKLFLTTNCAYKFLFIYQPRYINYFYLRVST